MIRLQELSKLLFFLFVVTLTVYVMFANKSKSLESFATGTDLTAVIRTIYKDLYGSEPNTQEMAFYSEFFKGKDPSKWYIREIISSSAPSLKKVLSTGSTSFIALNEDIQGTEQQVIAMFNQLLDRNPDAAELKYYSAFIKQGPKFLDTMKVQLIGSTEYQRLQKLQDNHANSGFLGGITDKQLELIITTLYKDVVKNNKDRVQEEDIDDETMTFLKKKYLEFEQQEGVFRQFLTNFVLFKPKKVIEDSSKPHWQNKNKLIGVEHFTQGPSKSQSYTPFSCDDAPVEFNLAPVPCIKPISATKPSMAGLINKRQRQELKDICERNSYYEDYYEQDL